MKRENILRIEHDLNTPNTECFEQLNPFETVHAEDFLKIPSNNKVESIFGVDDFQNHFISFN